LHEGLGVPVGAVGPVGQHVVSGRGLPRERPRASGAHRAVPGSGETGRELVTRDTNIRPVARKRDLRALPVWIAEPRPVIGPLGSASPLLRACRASSS